MGPSDLRSQQPRSASVGLRQDQRRHAGGDRAAGERYRRAHHLYGRRQAVYRFPGQRRPAGRGVDRGFALKRFTMHTFAAAGAAFAAGLLAPRLVGEPITPNLVVGPVAVFAGIWIATTETKPQGQEIP